MTKLIDFFKYDLPRGLSNLWRWVPLIWFDRDWDWIYIARVLEFKLLKHAELEEKYGHHVDSKLDAKRMRVCAYLLRRLQNDNYYENAAKRFPVNTKNGYLWKHAAAQQREDQKYLGLLLGKYLNHWWD